MDIKWNPFDDCIIASGSDDATVSYEFMISLSLIFFLIERCYWAVIFICAFM